MNESEIFARLSALHSALVEKLSAQPYIEPYISLHSGGYARITIWDRSRDNGGTSDILCTITAETIAGCLDGAEDYVAAMPNPLASQKANWHRKLGEVIDEGHALALPDAVMAPLRAGSQAMTENLLAHSPIRVEA